MSRILILEGPDGGGKTTLAMRLVHEHNFLYHHFGPPKQGEDVLHQYALILDHFHKLDRDVVIDRLHMGETVYGEIFRGTDRLGTEGVNILMRIINGFDVAVLVCLPSYSTAVENWKKKTGDMVENDVQYRQIYQRYMELSQSNLFGQPDIWSYEDYQFDYSKWCGGILKHRRPSKAIGNCGGFRRPRFLIVGEQANHEDLDLPFVALNGSSHYLYQCMELAGFTESETAFVNCLDLNNKPVDLHTLWNELGCPTPILLGRKAQAAFDPGQKMSTTLMIPHPAYWKRFHAGKQFEYVAMLAKIRKAANDAIN